MLENIKLYMNKIFSLLILLSFINCSYISKTNKNISKKKQLITQKIKHKKIEHIGVTYNQYSNFMNKYKFKFKAFHASAGKLIKNSKPVRFFSKSNKNSKK